MATTLNSISELSWRRIYPNASDDAAITRDEFFESAKSIYAESIWIRSKEEKREEGMWNVPSNLLTQVELNVVNNEIDLSELNILRSLPNEQWLLNIGGLICDCNYVRSDINLTKLLCDDEFQGDDKTYIVIGKKITFPKGTHATPLKIIYANDGSDVSGETEIDDSLGSIVRRALDALYSNRMPEDVTNNNNSNV